MIKKRVCINCPRGCELTVDTEKMTVEGNFCPRGKEYGINEVTHPMRTITSTAKIKGGVISRVSLRTNKPAPKEKRFDIRNEINHLDLVAPIHIGDILIKDVCSTGVDVIATKDVEKK